MDSVSENIFKRLISNLEDLVSLYRQMLDCVRRERDSLLYAKLEELLLCHEQKDQLIMKSRLADNLRQKLAAECAQAVGANTQQPRLLEIATLCNPETGTRLRQLHSALETLIRRILEINKENEGHAATALGTLNGALSDIKETLAGKKTYERKGQYKIGPEVTGNFVRKEA